MQLVDKVAGQVQAMGLPVVAVSLTAVPRVNTPVLLMLHWHGFARAQPPRTQAPGAPAQDLVGMPGSALQINERWLAIEHLDDAMLRAAWQWGAWDLVREERRGCNTAGASEQEALECRQAFAEHPFDGPTEDFMVAQAPDRQDLMQLAARVGYIRWQFRPVKNGLWAQAADDTLMPDGGRAADCPVPARQTVGHRVSRTRYQLGRSTRIVLL
ncbi:MAG: diguanylate cyclase [Rhodoferax sp.]|nr:diguanylate cyclase [Rhodoferax sp.]